MRAYEETARQSTLKYLNLQNTAALPVRCHAWSGLSDIMMKGLDSRGRLHANEQGCGTMAIIEAMKHNVHDIPLSRTSGGIVSDDHEVIKSHLSFLDIDTETW